MTVAVLGTNKKVQLEPGEVTLPGDIALAYARNRKTDGGDFDRAKRTQQVILGFVIALSTSKCCRPWL